jgi:hypothetical protein
MKLWHLPGLDDPPEPRTGHPRNIQPPAEPTVGPSGRAGMSPPERLDVPPERRPWDRTEPPPPPPAPGPRRIQIESLPHCDGRHGVGEGMQRCEWCDTLTDLISVVKNLETQVVILSRDIGALRTRLAERETAAPRCAGCGAPVAQIEHDVWIHEGGPRDHTVRLYGCDHHGDHAGCGPECECGGQS